MGDCGCDAPKYSGGFCYGAWSGLGCLNRGKLWDTDRCGYIIIKYPHDSVEYTFLEVRRPRKTDTYVVEPRIPLGELKEKFARFRDYFFGVYVEDNKLIIRTHVKDEVVADLQPL